MLSYFIKSLSLLSFSSFTIFAYYKLFRFHLETYSLATIFTYLIPVFIVYIIYKVLSIFVFNENQKEIKISYASMLFYFFINLFILCFVFFSTKEGFNSGQGFVLFFKIIGFLFLPVLIFSIVYGFGYKILSFIKGFHTEENEFKLLSSLGLGFFLFIAFLYIFAFFGFYNLYAVIFLLSTFLALGYKETIFLYKSFFEKKAVFENNTSLYTSEFLFFIISMLLSVNFILIFRPFPIGWDDLGVYMNTPNLLASAGKLLPLGSLQSWEIFTGIGFLFGSTTQAFYLNSFSGIIASIVIYNFSKSFFNEKNNFVNIALILVAIFLSMPMTIFQLGKDMKLDIGLFSFSLISIYITYYIFVKKERFIGEEGLKDEYKEKTNVKEKFLNYLNNHKLKKEFFKKEDYYYLFIAGLLTGFAFSIKMTSLMLFSGIIGLLVFNRIGFTAFIGFLSIYFAVFTKFHLWDMMNVVYPKGNIEFINLFSLFSFLIGILLIILSYVRHKIDYFIKSFCVIIIFILGFFTALTPWFIKNINEVGIKNISLVKLIGGENITYKPDLKKVYNKKEIEEINEKIQKRSKLDKDGNAVNADFGRYFGYEKGINNYLKLPYYLSMQKNQRGEFTDITYIFFALIPIIFLFLPFKYLWNYLIIYLFIIFEILYFFFPITKDILTNIIGNIELPIGYGVILLFYILTLLFFKSFTNRKQDKVLKLFLVNLSFGIFYIFLWNIAAFGIVWYGITMYMILLISIGVGIHYITRKEENKNPDYLVLKTLNFSIVFIIISTYFLRSSIPHIFNNFNEDYYAHYKAGIFRETDSIFIYHGEYFKILFELNIKDEKKDEITQKYKNKFINFLTEKKVNQNIVNIIKQTKSLDKINELLNYITLNKEVQKSITNYDIIKNELFDIRTEMFKTIVHPSEEEKNKAIIYRMGTFLKYFVSENNYRLYEDSLVFNFDDKIYDKDIEKTVKNFKDLGFGYILVDLNTPTIDKDPSHSLTTRFENLLKVFNSKNIKLIDTDSLCLKTGLEIYEKSERNANDLKNYLTMAGVNFESYEKNKQIKRKEKLYSCYNTILKLFNENKVNEKDFSYLVGIKDEYNKNKFKNKAEIKSFFEKNISAGYKTLFKIK